MNPSDAFLGVIDFFATLVPGAIATFLVMEHVEAPPFEKWPVIERGSAEGWATFLVAAFVLGHAISLGASTCFDPLYDRVYARWRRASSKYVRSILGKKTSGWRVLTCRVGHVLKKTNPDDELLLAAKTLKREQLRELAQQATVDPDSVSNTFWWAGTVVRATISGGATEIDALSAQSKFFRSMTLLIPFAALWVESVDILAVAGWAIALYLSAWRFLRLRWDATERTYEYFIVSRILSKRQPS